MAEFNKGDRVQVTYGVDTGKLGTVDHETVYVLVDGQGKLKPYAPNHLKPYVAPVPDPTPTPTPQTVPSGKLVFDGSADKVVSVAKPAPWGLVQQGDDPQYGAGSTVQIIDAPKPLADLGIKKAWKCKTTDKSASNGPRGEINDPAWLKKGEEWWVGDVLYVEEQGSWDQGHHTVFQLHEEGGSPPILSLDIRPDDGHGGFNGLGVQITDPVTNATIIWGGRGPRANYGSPLVAWGSLFGRPIQWEIGTKLSEGKDGWIEVWIDGAKALHWDGITLVKGLNMGVKQGFYGAGPHWSIFRGIRRGTTRDSVL